MTADLLTGLIGANLALAAAILAVLALRIPIRRLAGARLAYALWLIAPLAALASFLPPLRVAPSMSLSVTLRPVAQAAAAAIDTAFIQSAPRADPALAIVGLWLAGAAIALIVVVRRQRLTLALLGRLSPQAGGLLRAANPAIGPAVIGLIISRIVLPADFEQRFDPREQALILAHERAHLAAGDVRINALALLCACLNWFNPLVFLAARLIRQDQELACDAAVVARHPNTRRTYAQALLKTQGAPAPLPIGCYWPPRSPQRLKERIVMLTQNTPGRARRLGAAGVIATLGLGVSYAAWAANPQAAAPAIIQAVTVAAAPPGPAVGLHNSGPSTAADGLRELRFYQFVNLRIDTIPPSALASVSPYVSLDWNSTANAVVVGGSSASVAQAMDLLYKLDHGQPGPVSSAAPIRRVADATTPTPSHFDANAPILFHSQGSQTDPSNCTTQMTTGVVMTQDQSHLLADSVVTHSARTDGNCGKAIIRIDANGNVVYVAPDRTVRSDAANYDGASGTVSFTGDVVAMQGKNVTSADQGILDTKTDALVLSGHVRAMNDPNSLAPTKVADVQAPPRPSVITHPDWTSQPTAADLAKVFPERASRMDKDGRVVLQCIVGEDGALRDCTVMSEAPAGFGFGAAAVMLAPKFQMAPTTTDGASVAGAKVMVPVDLKRK